MDKKRLAGLAARRFGAIAAASLVAVAALIVTAARFDFLGAGFHVNFAMLLGVLGAIGVGVGLMALTFYSSRSGADDAVRTNTPEDPEP